FIGSMVELPVTVTQDYSLFHVLGQYGIDLWRQQIQLIMNHHGFMNFIIHPDYITEAKELNPVKQLLSHIAELRDEQKLWTPRPGEAAAWWRMRSRMCIVEEGGTLRIRGEGAEHARIAYASVEAGRLVYKIVEKAVAQSSRAI